MEIIAQIRRFNRTVTRHIGALEPHFLGRDRSMGASRVLFEIGPDGTEIRALRARLGLDSGYVSRLLRVLEGEGLVEIGPAARDARVRFVRLTAAGRSEVATLDRLSDRGAASILAPLRDHQRAALAEAMHTVERLLSAGAVVIRVENPSSRIARESLDRYYRELAERFEAGFRPETSLSASPDELTPPRGYFLAAVLDGRAVGCGVLKCHTGCGEIKRMWVDPSTRGLGIGRRLLERLEALARERALPVLRLETNRALTEARTLYRSSGYREVAPFNTEPYAHHWFEKTL